MAQRSVRNKLRHQSKSVTKDLEQMKMALDELMEVNGAYIKEKLKHSQGHMVYMASLACEQSDYINEHLPVIITFIDLIIKTWDKFEEGL